MVEAYELSRREKRGHATPRARGTSTADIARTLFTSPTHTVRDYVKAIFAKFGGFEPRGTRSEALAEHYAPVHLDPEGLERIAY